MSHLSMALCKFFRSVYALHETASNASVDTLAIFAGLSALQKCLLGSLPKPGLGDKVSQRLSASQAATAPVPYVLYSTAIFVF